MHLRKKLQTALRNLSLKKKIFYSCALVTSIVFLLFATAALNYAVSVSNDLLSRSIYSTISSSAGSMSYTLSDIRGITGMMIADSSIQHNLSLIQEAEDSSERAGAAPALRASLQSYYVLYREKFINTISLYTKSPVIHSDTEAAGRIPDDVIQEILAESAAHGGSPYWCTHYVEDYGVLLAREIRSTQGNERTPLATVLISIDISRIAEEASSYSDQYSQCSYLIYDDSRVVYASEEMKNADLSSIPDDFSSGYEIVDIDGHKYFAVAGNIPDFTWNYICLMSYDSTWQAMAESYLYFFLIVILALCIIFLIIHFILNHTLTHIDRLISKMKQYHGTASDLTLPDPAYVDRMDELGVLHQQFDHMAMEINDLIKHNYENEILMKDAQLLALEMQINPHFLYNTLETVNWRAKAIGESTISKMVESLGLLLRKTLSNKTEENTLKDELEIVNCYMTITKLRFDDRLIFECNVPEELEDALLPKLTLQPLVENAVHYALEEIADECHIRVEASLNEDELSIRVLNDGSQFDEDLLQKLENQTIIPRGLGIGLLNIHKRLQLFFDTDHGICFTNIDDFAVAEIRIPYRPFK